MRCCSTAEVIASTADSAMPAPASRPQSVIRPSFLYSVNRPISPKIAALTIDA